MQVIMRVGFVQLFFGAILLAENNDWAVVGSPDDIKEETKQGEFVIQGQLKVVVDHDIQKYSERGNRIRSPPSKTFF